MRAPLVRLLPALAALVLGAAPAFAAGLNLSWNDCGGAGDLQKSFACDTDNGVHVLFATAVIGQDLPHFVGESSEMELTVDQASLSPWWQMDNPVIDGRTGCRFGSACASFDFSDQPHCNSAWGTIGYGGLNSISGHGGPNRAWIRTVGAIPGSIPVTGDQEYAFFKIVIKSAKTGECAGCGDGACIVFRKLCLAQPAGEGDVSVTDEPLARNYVLWQKGTPSLGGLTTTPARNTTWGALKSMYR